MIKFFLVLFTLIACSTSEGGAKSPLYQVIRVVDGDTIVLSEIGKVRLIGVNTPETKDPRRPVQYFGKEASAFLTQEVSGKKVRLEYDQQRKDKFNRTLGYVYLEDGTHVNALIIKEGYGFAFTRYPFAKMEEFRKLERDAREKRRGLWAAKSETPQKSNFQCAKKRCKDIKTCDEARYLLKECGFSHLDKNGDGVPCENLCR